MNDTQKKTLTISLSIALATPFALFAAEELSEFLSEDPESSLTVDGVAVVPNPAAELKHIDELIASFDSFPEKTAEEARLWSMARLQFAAALAGCLGFFDGAGSQAHSETIRGMVQGLQARRYERGAEETEAEAEAEAEAEQEQEKALAPARAKQERPNVRRVGEPRPAPEALPVKTPRFAGSALHRTRLRGAVRRLR